MRHDSGRCDVQVPTAGAARRGIDAGAVSVSLRAFWILALALMLAGCFARPRAVVVERSSAAGVSTSAPPAAAPRAGSSARHYVVVRGDTLYGIAFRHGVDFRDLARWNRIASPYTIYPGQRLALGGAVAPRQASQPGPAANRPHARQATRAPVPAPAPPRAASGATVASGNTSAASTPSPPRANPDPASPAPPAAAGAGAAPIPAPTAVAAPPAAATPVSAAPTRTIDGVAWRWPASGSLIGRFVAGDPTRQGINIAGEGGHPVHAAAAGEVVYSGAGLIGYGELVIIKHSDTYLSAYGHNRRRLVAEGQRVAAGQQIAEMGRTGAARDMLHFEIRRNGKPVDPMPLLPAR